MSLTPRQAECRAFIASYQRTHGRGPSYSEIATGINAHSKSRVSDLVRGLAARGMAHLPRGVVRGIRLIEHSCPHCGGVLEPARATLPIKAMQ